MPEKEIKAVVFPRRCPECGAIEVYRETINYKTKYKYEGHLHEFEAQGISVNKCRACGEISLPNTALDQITEAFRSYANLLTAEQIRHNIQSLRLSQKEFAELIGVAPETVSRWLSNVQIQSRALDKLMQLFFVSAEVRMHLERMKDKAPAQATAATSNPASLQCAHQIVAASTRELQSYPVDSTPSLRFSRRLPVYVSNRQARFQLIANLN
jgi:putative zinc finger/helix-turn-helix YgiT family protein